MRTCRGTVPTVLVALLLAACGGSGSTGLVAPEQALLAEIRRDGTCVSSEEMITYCATDSPNAVTADGVSASGPLTDGGGPQPTATAGGPQPTSAPTPSGALATASPSQPTPSRTGAPGTSTPAAQGTATPGVEPTPCPTGGACPGRVELTFVVRGLPEGAVCALAARAAESGGIWSTGTLVPAGGATRTIEAPLPVGVGPGLVEIALLCFEMPRADLPLQIETLSAADPDVVFAPAAPITVATASGLGSS